LTPRLVPSRSLLPLRILGVADRRPQRWITGPPPRLLLPLLLPPKARVRSMLTTTGSNNSSSNINNPDR